MIWSASPTIQILPSFMETTALWIVSPDTVWAVAPTRKIGWSWGGADGARSWAIALVVIEASAVAASATMWVVMFMVCAFVCGGGRRV